MRLIEIEGTDLPPRGHTRVGRTGEDGAIGTIGATRVGRLAPDLLEEGP